MDEFLKSHRRILVAAAVLAAFDAAVWVAAARAVTSASEASLYFLDVGQGDSSIIVLPGAVQILVDGGPPNRKLLEELSEVLGTGDRYIDFLVMTHPQLDHFGGFIEALGQYEIGVFISNGRAGETDGYRALRDALAAKQVPYVALGEGDLIRYGSSRIEFFAPSPGEFLSEELNDTSLVFRLSVGGVAALYTGDIGAAVEERLAAEGNVTSDILKVPHHGSRFSSGSRFLTAVDPKVAVIEVGKNSYGHPTSAAIQRLGSVGATVFRTDRHGTIHVVPRGSNMQVFTEKVGNVDKK